MNEVVLLRGVETIRILQAVSEKKIPATMCYLSRGKWHIARILFYSVDPEQLSIIAMPSTFQNGEGESQNRQPRPINVQIDQSVGFSIKYEGGKLIFDTKVSDFGLSAGSMGGVIMLETPEQMEMVSRRSYFRVRVPDKLSINVNMRLRRRRKNGDDKHCTGRLIDLSAGGLQVGVEHSLRPDLHEGQYIKVKFSPLPAEAPIEFCAQIRNILPTADGKYLCFGLQIIGIEASKKGREVLSRLVGITELYYELNRSREGVQRSPQPGVRTKTYVKRCRSEWGSLLHP